ncbi:ribonuclease III [bacterium]|nr:ribonuclease III [bacterium]
MNKEREKQLRNLAKKINLKFKDFEMLDRALIHTSFVNENNHELKDNENLEFLGDAVLNLVVCEYLYSKYPNLDEGDLTKIKSHVVSAEVLATFSKRLNLGDFILLGKGEELTNGREKSSILADTFEALIAAIFLDMGFEKVKKFIISRFKSKIEKSKRSPHKLDFKSRLQEYALENTSRLPEYRILEETGPNHNKKFKVGLLIQNEIVSVGSGKTKKEAQQNAARVALDNIERQSKNGPGSEITSNV